MINRILTVGGLTLVSRATGFARDIVMADFEKPGAHDVVHTLVHDLAAAGKPTEEHTIRRQGELQKIDTTNASSKPTMYPIPKNAGMYDMDTDSKGRTHINIWREGKIGIFDPKAIEYKEYKTPTALSGPRRGQIDAQNRYWTAQFYAGQVLMFDPDKQIIKEYPLINGAKPYTAPYAEPYSLSVDDKNQIVWTNDFSASRLYRIDMNTGQSTEYMTPSNYELRDLKVDTAASRPTVWLPSYRPPSKLVKVEMR